MKLLTVDTIDEARRKLLDCTSHWKLAVEYVPLPSALGKILACDITSPEDIPHFRRSAVDGYAVFAADTFGAGDSVPVFLKIAGEVEMGKPADFSLNRGECAYVPTGGMIPANADAMVMVEYCEQFGADSVAVCRPVASGDHIAGIGEDARKGEILLKRGARIRPGEIGTLASAGITSAAVYVPPRLAVISSGDELVDPSATPLPGEMRDVNTFALRALAEESGYRVTVSVTVKDHMASLENTVAQAICDNDIIVLSGGSSQGMKDMTAEVFSRLAAPGVITHGLAIKPGKPTILGYKKVTDTVLVGLPGHPVSALVVFRVLLTWLIKRLTGQREPFPVSAKMSCNIAGSPGKTVYQPVALRPCDNGCAADPVYGKSGMIGVLAKSDGYIIIDLNREGLHEGETVEVFLWERD